MRVVDPLLEKLKTLEVELHHPGVRCSRERLEQILHPEFHEVGRSGSKYSRNIVIDYLASLERQPSVVPDAFAVQLLAPGCALLTYRSAHLAADGTASNHTLRSSLWVEGKHGWQVVYHQGTPSATAW